MSELKMTPPKLPEVFKAEDFILSERLKPWYCVKVATSGPHNKPVWSVLDTPCSTDTHVLFGLEPISIKEPAKVEVTREKLFEVLSIYGMTGHPFQDVAERLGL